MTKEVWKLLVFAVLFIPIVIIQGCTVEGDDVIVVDGMAPAAPRGVQSITGSCRVVS